MLVSIRSFREANRIAVAQQLQEVARRLWQERQRQLRDVPTRGPTPVQQQVVIPPSEAVPTQKFPQDSLKS